MQNEGEPSVEDILRSIKKVISRDDENAAQGGSIPNFGGSRPFGARDSFGGGYSVPPAANAADAQPAAVEDDKGVYDLGNLPESPVAGEELPQVPLPAAFAMAEEPRGESEPPVSELPVSEAAEADVTPSAEMLDDEEDTPSTIEITLGAMDDAEEGTEQEETSAPVPTFAAQPAPVTPEPATPQPVKPQYVKPEPAPATDASDEGLIAGATVAAMRDRIAALSSLSAGAPREVASVSPLEEVVREMLRPMLKEWLDDNLQGIIEKMVEAEIARITGRR